MNENKNSGCGDGYGLEANDIWDYCIIGNGVSALWMSHSLWTAKKSVVWITTDRPFSAERAMLQHGWLWNFKMADAAALDGVLNNSNSAFELTYYDAKSSRRFRNPLDVKIEWGEHEVDYFKTLLNEQPESLDLWDAQTKLSQFHDSGEQIGPTRVELFSDPKFTKIQNWPILEILTKNSKIDEIKLSKAISIKANNYILGDYDESLPQLIRNEEDAKQLTAVLKGRSFRPGFGLKFWHDHSKNKMDEPLSQIMIIPLTVASSEKHGMSHVVGRFKKVGNLVQSYWVGLLTDDEIEDNNEILRKIKQVKRAVERAVPSFSDSISKESVTFELKMFATDLIKKRSHQAIGATLISDCDCLDMTIQKLNLKQNPEIRKLLCEKLEPTTVVS